MNVGGAGTTRRQLPPGGAPRRVAARVVRAAAGRVRARFGRGAVILLYHRVAALSRDPWSLAVTPAHFEAHVAALRRGRYALLSLAALAEAHAAGQLPRRAVAVTFDDAYADVGHTALPVLATYGVPATVFAVSGSVGVPGEFWWDELDRLVAESERLPAVVELPRSDGAGELVSLPGGAQAAPQGPRGEAARREAYFALWARFRELPHAARRRALDQLAGTVRVRPADPRDYPMDADALRRFADSGVGTVGAHTVTHPKLAQLAPDEQRREVAESRGALERVLARPVDLFAYPFGNPDAYSPHTVDAVRGAGFRAACVNGGGAVRAAAPALELPRVYVDDADAAALVARVEQALRG